MKIHKEGKKILFYGPITLLILIIIFFVIVSVRKPWEICVLVAVTLGVIGLLFFYRHPSRRVVPDDKSIYIPADGKIVACEKVVEKHFFNDERIQVSIFMSLFNVHVNWVPATGKVIWKNHKDGSNYPAYNPKASELNEMCQTVIKLDNGDEIMITQIAGLVARRVVNRKEVGETVKQGEELGIIKFGSRVDVFLPTSYKIEVNMGQPVRAIKTVLAKI